MLAYRQDLILLLLLLLLIAFKGAIRDRLVGLVVKASASRAGGPGFESR